MRTRIIDSRGVAAVLVRVMVTCLISGFLLRVHAQAPFSITPAGHIGGITQCGAVSGNYTYLGQAQYFSVVDISRSPFQQAAYLELPNAPNDIFINGNYAYLSASGLRIVDISNPLTPTITGYHALGDSSEGELVVSGNYAYVAAGRSGLKIADVSKPASPQLVATYLPEAYSRISDVVVQGDYAYVIDEYRNFLRILDVSDPVNPVEKSNFYIANLKKVFVQGNNGYVANEASPGNYVDLHVLDISNPSAPAEVGYLHTKVTDLTGLRRPTALYVDGNHAYIGVSSGLWLVIADISDPNNPTTSATMEIDSRNGAVNSLQVVLPYAYLTTSVSERHLMAVDVSNPANPAEVDDYGSPGDVLWVQSSSDYLYVADIRGLWVYDASDPARPLLVKFYSRWPWMQRLFLRGNLLYGFGRGANNQLRIMDVSDVNNVTELSAYQPRSGAPTEMYATAGYAYLLVGDKQEIVDVSDPANPAFVSTYALPGTGRDIYVNEGKGLAYLAYSKNGDEGFQIVNVSNAQSPALLGSAQTAGKPIAIWAVEDTVYTGSNTGSEPNTQWHLEAFNVSDPSAPTRLAHKIDSGEIWDVEVKEGYIFAGIKGGSVWGLLLQTLLGNFITLDICHSPSTTQISTTVTSSTGTGYVTTTEGYGGSEAKDISGNEGLITQKIKIEKKSGEGCVATIVVPNKAAQMGCSATPECVDQSGGTVQVTAKPTADWVFWKWTGAASGTSATAEATPAPGTCTQGCSNVATANFLPWLKISGQGKQHICPVTENEEERLIHTFTVQGSNADSWQVNTVTVKVAGDTVVTQPIKKARLEWPGGEQTISFSGGGSVQFSTSGLTLQPGESKSLSFYLTFGKMEAYQCESESTFKQLSVAIEAGDVAAVPDNYPPGVVLQGAAADVVVACVYNVEKSEPFGNIQTAVDAASPGNTILVCPGYYEENVNVNQSLTIRSVKGRGVTTVKAAEANQHVFTVTQNNTTIQGFTIKGATGQGKAGIYVHGSTVSGSQILDNYITGNSYGVYLQAAQETQIKGNLVLNNNQTGLYMNTATESRVQENSFSDNGNDGILMENCQEAANKETRVEKNSLRSNDESGIHLRQCSGVTITDNVSISENELHGIFIENSSRIAISDNPIIERNAQSGIRLLNCQLQSGETPITIRGNTIQGSKRAGRQNDGIFLESCQGVRIGDENSKNTILNHPQNGIHLLNCQAGGAPEFNNQISGNVVKFNTKNGIFLESSWGSVISGSNTIGPDNGNGIHVSKSEALYANEIFDATIEGNEQHGIFLESSYRTVIGDSTKPNLIKSNKANGIYLQKCDSPLGKENKISGNSIESNTGSGVFLDESHTNIINGGNQIKSNKEHGIVLKKSDINQVEKNNIEGNTKHGIFMEACGNSNMIEKNRIKSNSENGIHVVDCGYPNGTIRHAIFGNTIQNSKVGIYLESSCNIWIGVWDDGESPLYDANTIGPNKEAGIKIVNATCTPKWGNYIASNVILNNPYGIYLHQSNGHRIGKENQIKESTKDGIYLWQSVQNQIHGNTIGPGNQNGVSLVQCQATAGTPNEIYANTIMRNRNHGVYLEASWGNRIGKAGDNDFNQIRLNTGDGIHLQDCQAPENLPNIVEENLVTENNHGIYLNASTYNEIIKNGCTNKKDGIHLTRSHQNKLHGNECLENGGNGIYLKWSKGNEIAESEAYLNGESGIYLYESNENVIPARKQKANVMEENGDHGLRLDASHYNDFYDNETKRNKKHGVILNRSRRNRFLGKLVAEENTKSGIVLDGSVLNEIEGSLWLKPSQAMKYPIRARGNGKYGVHFRYSSNNRLSRTNITGHSTGLFLEYANDNIFADGWIKVNGIGVWEKCSNNNNWGVLLITHNGNMSIIEGCSQPTSKFYGCVFTGAESDAIIVKNGAAPIFEKCSFYDNAGLAINNKAPSVRITARHNWWGDASGPGGDGPGAGDGVGGNVDFSNWRTSPLAVVASPVTDTLFVSPGAMDSLVCFFQNWQKPEDVLNVTVAADSMHWLASAGSFSLALADSVAADTTIYISAPSTAKTGAASKFTLAVASQSNPSEVDTASFLVVIYNSQLTRIAVEPDTVLLRVEGSYLFAATGYDSLGKPIDVAVQWHSQGGTIDENGFFQAGDQPGSYLVWAVDSLSGFADTSSVTILPNLASVTISPDFVQLKPQQTQQFTVSGRDTVGNAVQVFPLWSATGGIIDSVGLYTAGSDTGSYWVTVIDQFSHNLRDSALVVIGSVTYVETDDEGKIPTEFAVYQNYPNPFNPSTTIRFDVAKSAHVEMILYDVRGRQVSVLVNRKFEPGQYQVKVSAANIPSGIYFYSVKMGPYYRVIKKMLILK